MAAVELVMTMDDDSEREVEKYRQSDGKGIALVFTNSKGMGGMWKDEDYKGDVSQG